MRRILAVFSSLLVLWSSMALADESAACLFVVQSYHQFRHLVERTYTKQGARLASEPEDKLWNLKPLKAADGQCSAEADIMLHNGKTCRANIQAQVQLSQAMVTCYSQKAEKSQIAFQASYKKSTPGYAIDRWTFSISTLDDLLK